MDSWHWIEILLLVIPLLLNFNFALIILFNHVRLFRPHFRSRRLPNTHIMLFRSFFNTINDCMILYLDLLMPEIDRSNVRLPHTFIDYMLGNNFIFGELSMPHFDSWLGVAASFYLICEDNVLVGNENLLFKAFFFIVKFFDAILHHKFLRDNR